MNREHQQDDHRDVEKPQPEPTCKDYGPVPTEGDEDTSPSGRTQ